MDIPVRTGTYWYIPVHTILPDPVQVYRIPDEPAAAAARAVTEPRSAAACQCPGSEPRSATVCARRTCRRRKIGIEIIQVPRCMTTSLVKNLKRDSESGASVLLRLGGCLYNKFSAWTRKLNNVHGAGAADSDYQ